MGAWGSGPFDNDNAADSTYQLTDRADEGVVARALRAAADAPSPGAAQASAAVAAAEVVAAGLGRPSLDLPDEFAAWVAARADRPWADLVAPALAALDRVQSDSELAEVWEEAGDDGWTESLGDLQARLAPAT